ncbi:hypothetical protein [uncultured Gordonia sp.]|uniref:hypothetical protein n=1 Tax=uncultured Gordonia sp. TaxID=198437 RepID=UPI002609CF83|nr:hypothetical protein [uncultured Gordonia sp.]
MTSRESSVVKVQLDESALAHYASPYYDPVKAKEYYERTKKLKGRNEGELSDTQKEAFGYAKNQITEEKTKVLKDTADKQREAIENIRRGAQAMREAVAARVTELLAKVEAAEAEQRDRIAAERAEKLQAISDKAAKAIAALPPVPPGVSKERAAELAANRRAEIAAIKGDSKREREQVAADSADAVEKLSEGSDRIKGSARGSANLDRDAIVKGVQGAIAKAQKDFDALKEAVKAKYETKYQSEYDAIKNSL